ncbi:MAG: PepSY-like domain-containing protein, partial [Muribaculum sp.]|nr:PepSY-like domain-containing protein [Muribaculum sp.]
MKKILATMLLMVVASVSATIFAGTPIKQSELPKAAQSFITKYFPKDQVRKVEKDNGRRGMEYEVDFTSGAEVDFTSDGNWKEVKAARGTSVPSEIIPTAIAKYVATNFEGQ